jgi:hypothetical protein
MAYEVESPDVVGGALGLSKDLVASTGRVVNLGVRPVPEYDVYIGRTFAGRTGESWGNPVKLGEESPEGRARVIVNYWKWLNGPSGAACSVRSRIRTGELDGKVLACWCAGKGLCHGFVLAGLADGLVDEVKGWVSDLQSALGEGDGL